MLLRPALLVLALSASSLAWGEPVDPAERIGRLTYIEGEATFQAAHAPATTTLPDRPLNSGDRIATERDGRAELALGTSTIRLDERSELAILDFDATTIRVELTSGTASVYLDELLEGETFKVVTPNTTITLDEPGEYRVDVHADDVSVLAVRSGTADVATAGGPVRVAAGQRVRIEGRDAIARLETPRPADAFDDWVLERELRLAEAEPARYTPYEGDRYDELDRYGEWYEEPRYGRVWMPGYGYSGWSPYGGGYWQRAGFGWSWIDPAPWGYFTYYGGRWTYLRDRNRWCWVPTRHQPRHDTRDNDRPYWYPRQRDIPESAPRTADRQLNTGNGSEPVVIARSTPRRIDPDRRPTQARENAADERPRGGIYARGGNQEPNRSQPATAPPQGGGTTIRPSNRPPPRARPSPDSSPRISRGTVTPQEP
jgi:hypothetical protein